MNRNKMTAIIMAEGYLYAQARVFIYLAQAKGIESFTVFKGTVEVVTSDGEVLTMRKTPIANAFVCEFTIEKYGEIILKTLVPRVFCDWDDDPKKTVEYLMGA